MPITTHTAEELDALESRLIEAALGRGLVDPSTGALLTRSQIENNVRTATNALRSSLGYDLTLGPAPAVVALVGAVVVTVA